MPATHNRERQEVLESMQRAAKLALRAAEEIATWPASIERAARAARGAVIPLDLTSNATLVHAFEQRAAERPQHPFLLYRDQRFTYREANDRTNLYAHAYKALGLKKGDVVALVMENRPGFLWHFFALAKLGVVASLINTHAIGKPLAHALRICKPQRIIVGSEVLPAYEAIRDSLFDLAGVPVDVDTDDGAKAPEGYARWSERLPKFSVDPAETSRQTLGDQAAYIYTSGTTGAPKAARVMHHRLYRAGLVWGGAAFRYRPDDVIYIALPLYHGNGLMLGVASAVTFGVTIALARKFSTTAFWDDCRRTNATSFLYIGELCRYLNNAPRKASDRDHTIRSISGNGLRPDIWESFQERFGIERIAEFYGATEGNVITLNVTNVAGSVGKMLPGHALARWDEAAGDFVRGPAGRLVRCRPGEVGVLLGKIKPTAVFDGYEDKVATERKIVRDAFAAGDAYFNTGDLLRIDWRHNLYFADRLGDTFRWKGENVSTFEVQEQVSAWPPVREVNVYGVAVPGTDGRAGMAALVLAEGTPFDAASFKAHVDATLPRFARPIFVRVDQALEVTGTMKMKKGDLQKQGIDPAQVTSPLFVRHPSNDTYVALDAPLYGELTSGKVRL